jgi:hypothetical protein
MQYASLHVGFTRLGTAHALHRQATSVVDLTTALIALVVFGITWLRWKIPEPVIVLGAALVGLATRG